MWLRSALVVLDFNHGVSRSQEQDENGALRYKLTVSIAAVTNIIHFLELYPSFPAR